jgi:hypothetical protein
MPEINADQRWISVKDRLPDKTSYDTSNVVLVAVKVNPECRGEDDEDFVWISQLKFSPDGESEFMIECEDMEPWDANPPSRTVTHWMPLPAPPEVVSG